MPAGVGSRLTSLVLRASPIQLNPPCPTTNKRAGVEAEYPAGTYPLVDNGNTLVVNIGDGVQTIEKIAGAAGYNAAAVSSIGLTGDFVLRMKALTFTSSNYFGGGMNTDPLTDNNYASVDFLLLCAPSINRWDIYESGTGIVLGTGATNSDYVWIWRVGTSLNYGHGPTLAAAQAAPDRTVIDSSTLYFDSASTDIGDKLEVLLADLLPTTAYSMTADAGVFTFTGQPVNFLLGYNMAAGLGTFSLSGQPVNLQRGYIMPAGQATFSYTGQAAALARGYSMPAGQATFSYTGQPVTLQASYTMTAGLGSFSYSGQAALLARGYSMPAGQAAFAYSGQPVNFLLGYSMAAGLGTFTLNGQPVSFGITATMPAAAGIFSYTGQPVRATLNLASFPSGGSGGSGGARVVAFFYRG